MTELQRLLYKQLYKKDFYSFIKDFWNEMEPAKLIDGNIIKIYSEIFIYTCRKSIPCKISNIKVPDKYKNWEVIDIREDKQNININVPPRHTKSLIFSVLGPVWLWINNSFKAASISHSFGLSKDLNIKRQRIINSEKFKYFFGEEFKLISNSADLIRDNRGGELYAKCRQSILGFGADLIINDDLTNAEVAKLDKQEMTKAWTFYSEVLPTRFNDINTGVAINLQQRLGVNDITGHIIADPKLRKTYSFVVLPAQFQKDTVVICPISGDIIEFKKGDYLWPERFGDYSTIRNQITESSWQTLYLQNPSASEKAVIQEDMIVEKDLPDTPGIENADIIYASHDFPVKDKDSSDFLGSLLCYRNGATLYITDCLEKHMAFVKSVNYVKQLDTLYPGIIQVIEDKANGSPILQQLQDEVPGMQAFQPGTASKTQRLESSTLYMNSGNVVFVKTVFNKLNNQWELSPALQNLKDRLLAFPFVEHDDICDAFSMIILFVFMDRRYLVYGKAFNDMNIVNIRDVKDLNYSNIFFNKEGDTWKVLEIGIKYGINTELYIKRETRFKASMEEGLSKLKEFSPKSNVFIDCSATEGLRGMANNNITLERYEIEDFDKSVVQTNLAFSKKLILLDKKCLLTKNDIENFKFTKNKDDTVKYLTEKDGFISCIRTALKFYGGII